MFGTVATVELLESVPSGTWLAEIALKGSVILLIAVFLTSILRGATARVRYVVWTTAILGTLSVPLLARILPAWTMPVLPMFSESVEVADVAPLPSPFGDWPDVATPALDAEALKSIVIEPLPVPPLASRSPTRPTMLPAIPVEGASTSWMEWVWRIGVLLVALRLGTGILGVSLIERRSHSVEDPHWRWLLLRLRHQLGVTRPVRLLLSTRVTTPMTWGLFRPRVVLPVEALSWPRERQRVVLLHELTHVHRRDWAVQLLGQLTCACHWFNPLVWWASRSLSLERERACDEDVLAGGTRPSDYAQHLLEVARTMGSAPHGALAMAGSLLEERVRSILTTQPARRSRASLPAVLLMGAAVFSLSALQPWAPPPGAIGAEPDSAAIDESWHFDTDPLSPEARPELHMPTFTMRDAKVLLDGGHFDEAIVALRQITGDEPQNGRAWFWLGFCYHQIGDLDRAVPADREAARYAKVRPEALYNLACAYAQRGNVDLAFTALEQAEAAGFDSMTHLELDPDLDNLRLRTPERFRDFCDDFFPPRRTMVAR